MRVEATAIDGVARLGWSFNEDARGSFGRTFCRSTLADAGIGFTLVQANLSRNPVRHTLRGIHLQRAPHGEPKIISCARGRIWDVAVDLRPHSATYRRWLAFELGADSDTGLYLAEGIGHGFLTLEPDTEVHYLMGAAFVPAAAGGVRWDDPALAIRWPEAPALISDRDRGFPLLEAARG